MYIYVCIYMYVWSRIGNQRLGANIHAASSTAAQQEQDQDNDLFAGRSLNRSKYKEALTNGKHGAKSSMNDIDRGKNVCTT